MARESSARGHSNESIASSARCARFRGAAPSCRIRSECPKEARCRGCKLVGRVPWRSKLARRYPTTLQPSDPTRGGALPRFHAFAISSRRARDAAYFGPTTPIDGWYLNPDVFWSRTASAVRAASLAGSLRHGALDRLARYPVPDATHHEFRPTRAADMTDSGRGPVNTVKL
jgi:hypothetical protein